MNEYEISLIKNVFDLLNRECNYAVLRNYENLPFEIKGADIDILIDLEDYRKIEQQLVKVISDCGYYITTLYKSGRMFTFVCASIQNEPFKVDIIQFDFFFNTSIFGVVLIESDTVLAKKQYNGKIFHVSREFEFLDKYLYLKCLNVKYPDKYSAIQREAEHSAELPGFLENSFHVNDLTKFMSMPRITFVMWVIWRNIKCIPYKQIRFFTKDWMYAFSNLIYPKGISIGFTGPDGSGKTTILNLIEIQLGVAHYSISKFHFRPHLLKNIGEIAVQSGLTKSVDLDYSNPHRGKPVGVANSFARLLYYSFDYILGYYKLVRAALYKRSIVIFDRYFTDIVVDGRRSRIFLNFKFLSALQCLLIPKLQYNILLTADADVILSRKQEITRDGINSINKKIEFLSNKKGFYKVLNTGAPENAAFEILKIICQEQHRKNLHRLRTHGK